MNVVAHLAPLFAGMAQRLALEVSTTHDTKIDFIAIAIHLTEGWDVGSNSYGARVRRHATLVERRIAPAGVIPKGMTRYEFEVTVPADTPPTHVIAPAFAAAELRVHVSLPWRIDIRQRYPVIVRHAPAASPAPPSPGVWRSLPARPDAPRLELGIAADRVAAGDTLIGSCALHHVDDRNPREVEISLVADLELYGSGAMQPGTGSGGSSVTVALPVGSAGASTPFALPIPSWLPPTYEGVTHTVRWQVEARAGGWFSRVRVLAPLVIVDRAAHDPRSAAALPPGLTDDRVAGVFANFASARGWHPVTGEHVTAVTIARDVGDAQLQLAYKHRAEAGTFLVARVAHPSLGLGLEVAPSSSLRHAFLRDLEVGVPTWDRAHLVHARDEEQARPVLRAAVAQFLEVTAVGAPGQPTHLGAGGVTGVLGACTRWTDHGIAFERAVIAVTAIDLERAEAALGRVADAIAAARALARPPAGCVIDLDEWRALAASLGGPLGVADLSIAGALRGLPVQLGLAFDDDARPVAVRVRVGDPESAGEVAREVSLALAHPAAEVADSDAPEALRDAIAAWPAAVVDLHLADGVATAALRLAPAEPRVIAAAPVRELVVALAGLLAALAPGAGPYR